MGTVFWVKRFLVVMAGALVIISSVQWLKGHSIRYALMQGALWGVISAGVFVATRIYRSRRGEHCAMCRDTPETR